MELINDRIEQGSGAQDHSEEIAEVAYYYWQSRGCEAGHDVQDWLMAEQEVLRRYREPAGAAHAKAA